MSLPSPEQVQELIQNVTVMQERITAMSETIDRQAATILSQSNQISSMQQMQQQAPQADATVQALTMVASTMQTLQIESKEQAKTLQALSEGLTMTSKGVRVSFQKVQSKLKSIKDASSDFQTWQFKLITHCNQCLPQFEKLLNWAANHKKNEEITEETILREFGPDAIDPEEQIADIMEWDAQIFALLAGLVEEHSEAASIVQNTRTKSGLDTWR